MRDFLMAAGGVSILFIVSVFLVTGVILGGKTLFEKPACEDLGRLTGHKTVYSYGNGCLINVGGRWVDSDIFTWFQASVKE